MRAVLVTGFAALLLALPASAADWSPSATWLLQARCVHLKEGPWTANTGNGYFGGMQFARQTWKRVGGKPDPAFTHPGNKAYPFTCDERRAALSRVAALAARRRNVALVGRRRRFLLVT